MAIPKLLRDLLTTAGPSGYEQAPAAVFRKAASKFAEVTNDSMGSTVARVKGTGKGPHLAVVGHIDEIGLIVNHIDDDGFLWFTNVGGWDPIILVGQRVEISTRDGVIPGVVGRKAIHLFNEEDRKKVPRLKDLHIDIAAKDGDEARKAVRIGDVAVVAGEPVELRNNCVATRSLDNRIGCYVAYEAARLVAKAGGARGDISAVAAVQEEIGLKGAQTTAFSLNPDLAIAVDVAHATDTPAFDHKGIGIHPLGSGPLICRGSTLDPQIFELLCEAGDANKIPYTVEASSRSTGTDADGIATARGGIPTGLVSVPIRYMHSPVELMQTDDVQNAAKLIAEFALRLKPRISFLR